MFETLETSCNRMPIVLNIETFEPVRVDYMFESPSTHCVSWLSSFDYHCISIQVGKSEYLKLPSPPQVRPLINLCHLLSAVARLE